MDAQAKIELHNRAEEVTDKILSSQGILQKEWLLNLIFAALQAQDVAARERCVEALSRTTRGICEGA